jgi:hypothetical protein
VLYQSQVIVEAHRLTIKVSTEFTAMVRGPEIVQEGGDHIVLCDGTANAFTDDPNVQPTVEVTLFGKSLLDGSALTLGCSTVEWLCT